MGRDNVIACLNHEKCEVPYTLDAEPCFATSLGQEWLDRIDPDLVMITVIRNGMHLVRDDVVSKDMYGSWWKIDAKIPHVVRPALRGPFMGDYKWPDLNEFVNHAGLENEQNYAKYAKNEADKYVVANLTWGLWETFSSMRGYQYALMDSLLAPDFFEEVLDVLTDRFIEYTKFVCVMVPEVDCIFYGDDWGDQRGVILGPDNWRKFLKPRWEKIYSVAHSYGKKIAHHTCGSVVDIMDDIIEIGLDVLESVQPEARDMEPLSLKKRWGDKICFWGCLGSQWPIGTGTPDDIYKEVERLREGMGSGYILAPAKRIMEGTPIENVKAVIEAVTRTSTKASS